MNWMRWNPPRDDRREGPDGEGLGEARHAFQQHVPVGQQADEQALQERALADDDATQLGEHLGGEAALLRRSGSDGPAHGSGATGYRVGKGTHARSLTAHGGPARASPPGRESLGERSP